jgi:hypothetical protein
MSFETINPVFPSWTGLISFPSWIMKLGWCNFNWSFRHRLGLLASSSCCSHAPGLSSSDRCWDSMLQVTTIWFFFHALFLTNKDLHMIWLVFWFSNEFGSDLFCYISFTLWKWTVSLYRVHISLVRNVFLLSKMDRASMRLTKMLKMLAAITRLILILWGILIELNAGVKFSRLNSALVSTFFWQKIWHAAHFSSGL